MIKSFRPFLSRSWTGSVVNLGMILKIKFWIDSKHESAKILIRSLGFVIKILIKSGMICYKFQTLILEKFWRRSWSKRERISQFKILIDLVIFLLKFLSSMTINVSRMQMRKFESDLDNILFWILSASWNSVTTRFFQELKISWTSPCSKLVVYFMVSW